MSRFGEELRVIPRVMWVISVVAYAGVVTLLLTFFEDPPKPVYFFAFFIPLVFASYLLLTGYVYGDAKRRGMRAWAWALLVVAIPSAIGFILYFMMREPLRTVCPSCGGMARSQFAFCPHCGTALAHSCPQCRNAVDVGWPHCPYCGVSLTPTSAAFTK